VTLVIVFTREYMTFTFIEVQADCL